MSYKWGSSGIFINIGCLKESKQTNDFFAFSFKENSDLTIFFICICNIFLKINILNKYKCKLFKTAESSILCNKKKQRP